MGKWGAQDSGQSWESRLDALRRQHSHRSCRGFPRSSSLSPGVYLRKRSLTLSRARWESDLSFIRGAGETSEFTDTPRAIRARGYLSVVSKTPGSRAVTADNTFLTYLYDDVAWRATHIGI